ncbi:hypothetical protein [Streptomyces noursei]|uniref:hypothetical protein n=1 Tax=Streptomyces noursei TaxID=1971 RepID=UPI0011AF4518|nr:hypothetical protein [Streptomyces noursei]
MGFNVHLYPDPNDGFVPWTEVFEVTDTSRGEIVASDSEVRDHPEAPLSGDRRDAVLARLGFRRTGPWDYADEAHVDAPCERFESGGAARSS